MMKTGLKKKFNPVSITLLVMLIVYVIGLFLPVFWSVIVSFMDTEAFVQFTEENILFKKFFSDNVFQNYKTAFQWIKIKSGNQMFRMSHLYVNSLLYAGISASVFTLCPTIVAYATARFKFRSSKMIYVFVIIAMSLPIVGATPSELRMLDRLHMRGTMFSMLFLRFNFLSVYYLILYALFEGIPMDYTEAAKIDGASNLVIMFKIIVPQALNMILTVFILVFITYWNDFQIPMLYLPDYPTVAYFLYYYSGDAIREQSAYNGYIRITDQLAATIILALPIIMVFVIFNKRLRVSVAMGGVKG